MTIPSSSNYPAALDDNTNLYEVHDSARVKLTEDYKPGDKSITVTNDALALAKFPTSGLITLTEQCSEPDKRAISFFYSSRADNVFSGLEILPGFEDVIKSKKITNVTQNVMAAHHNQIKDSVIAIEKFIGIKGTDDKKPLGETMEGRINFLRKLVLRPRVWFTSDRTTGIVPFTVEFNELSFQTGTDGTTGDIHYTWDFGDQTNLSLVSTISVTDEVPGVLAPGEVWDENEDDVNVIVKDTDGGKVKKTYFLPGKYDVSLTVKNDMGSDVLELPEYIYARIEAPDESIINLLDRPGQFLLEHDRYDGNGDMKEGVNTSSPPDFTTTFPPILKTKVGTIVDIQIPGGKNTVTGKSYSGELLDDNDDPIDPVTSYTWSLSDDLTHANNRIARAAYSIGGLYNVTVRTDTDLMSYRITHYPNVIDVVEDVNLWLWNYSADSSTNVRSYEFGLLSETFKTEPAPIKTLNIDSSFLSAHSNSEQLVKEFDRNNGMAQRTTATSGNGGDAILYWATGRSASQSETTEDIDFLTYNAFQGTYSSNSTVSSIQRQWNWIGINALEDIYFLLGVADSPAESSLTNQSLVKKNLQDFSSSSSTFTDSDYKNGADELKNNVATFNDQGAPNHGHFSAYRTAYKNNTGYIIRNDGVGGTFRLKSFYRTEGVTSDPIQTIRKLTDMPGTVKLEGQLVPLTSGLYFFDNSSAISVYNDVSNVWETGQSLATSFVSLQDTSVTGFGDATNTLLATSDGDRKAYLSFDYSSKAFVSFNETDLTFKSLGSRPTGTQWQMGIY